jgi:hypothetical protein
MGGTAGYAEGGVNWSEKDLQAVLARHAGPAPFHMPANQAGHFALGRLPAGTMNKTEAAYDAHLWQQHSVGAVLWHKFEGIKLRLADNTFLTVDFAVLPKSGVLEMHECKGGWFQDDAKVKVKVAASIYPFRFIVVRKAKGGGWEREEFS